MPDDVEWISAARALALLKPVLGGHTAKRAICKRAHDGLIRSRAERFTVGGNPRDDSFIPKAFWWAEGQAALEQNWDVGDFETWIDHKLHLRAFGVEFPRTEIEKLLPAGTGPQATASASAIANKGLTMDEMAWALGGLTYLREARRNTHEELNEAMNELREMAPTARNEPWYVVCKSVLPALYHYSDEYPADGKIPGEKYASPQDFAVALPAYRAFMEQMRDELNEADAAYQKAHNLDGPPFLLNVIRERVLYFISAIEHVEAQRPSTIATGVTNDLALVTRLASRFHESVLALKKHPYGREPFPVADEWDCQYLFHAILKAYFSDIRPEEWSPSNAGSASRCEFFLKDQRLMVELKYVRQPGDQKKIKGDLLVDFSDYGGNADVDQVIVLVYDPNHHLPQAVPLQKDLVGPFKGLKRVQVIVSPPRS